jgi:hypothetical protein
MQDRLDCLVVSHPSSKRIFLTTQKLRRVTHYRVFHYFNFQITLIQNRLNTFAREIIYRISVLLGNLPLSDKNHMDCLECL